MRVAHLASIDLTVRYLLLPQLLRLREDGYDVTAICAPGPRVPEIEAAGIRHVPWRRITRAWSPSADAAALRELVAILRRERFDLLHTHNPKPGIMGRFAAAYTDVPCVVNTVHGLYATPNDRLCRRLPVLALEALAARSSDLELYQSEEDLAWAAKLGLGGPERRVYLGNGVDLDEFDPARVSEERRSEVRAELGVPDGALLVGTVSRLVAEKGVREFLTAARRLSGHEARFVVVGPSEPDKADAIAEDARAAGVTFTGMRTDVRDLLAAFDVFVLASWREGLPRSAIEAAAMGKPLVLTDIRGCREVARDGVEGILVPPRDAHRLTQAISRLLGDAPLRARLSAAARMRATERFDERRVFDVLLREYRRVLVRKGLLADDAPVNVRHARAEDVPAIARLHREGLPDAFLSKLGERFLRRFYRALVEHDGAVSVVAESAGRPIGFATGVVSTRAFARRFYVRHGVAAAVAAAPALLRGGVVRGIRESRRYAGSGAGLPEAEIISIAIASPWRRRGVAQRVAEATLSALAELGAKETRVLIADDNDASNRLFARVGLPLRKGGRVVVHGGTASTVWVTRCRS